MAAIVPLAVGCGDKPPSGLGGTQAHDDELPHSGAPAIENPLDPKKFEAAPCAILNGQHLRSLGIKDARKSEEAGPPGPKCRFERDDALLWSLSVTFMTSDKEGLSRLYENEQVEPAGYFEAVPSVSDYPGVLTGLIDDRKEGDCGLVVGIRDDLTVQVLIAGSSSGDPCRDATDVGQVAVEQLKAVN